MKVFLRSVLIVAFFAGLVHATDEEERLYGPNTLRSQPYVHIYQQDKMGMPTFVQGDLGAPVRKGGELEATIEFLVQHRTTFGMTDPVAELWLGKHEVDELSMTHVRLLQHYRNVRVLGGELVSHFSAAGALRTVNGTFRPGIDMDVTPTLSANGAVNRAQLDLQSFFGKGEPNNPELVIFPWDDSYYLCWRVFLYSDAPMGRWEYLIDAGTGEVIYNANRIMETEAVGTGTGVMGLTRSHIDTDYDGISIYEMRDYTRQLNNDIHGHGGQMPDGNYLQTNIASTSLPGSIAVDVDNSWTGSNQHSAVDGHVYSALVYDYMVHHLGRNGYDDAGASMLTIVDYSAEGNDNAYWDGSRIVIWSNSSGWRSLAGCPDVVAHEWGHAITETCSDLVYELESGALNESFSDMIGAAFEFAHDSMDTPDWLMGENGEIGGSGFRDMENPHNFNDPDYYGTSDPYWVNVDGCSPSWSNDYCGVHTNSGVGNKWFFLLSDGGLHNGVTVTGIGAQNALLVAYRANRYYWTTNTNYHDGALGTISAANDLDTTSLWVAQVANAWNAVGVSTPGPSLVFDYPVGTPTTTTPNQPETFQVVVSGFLGGDPVDGSGQLYYSIDGGTWTEGIMTETSSDHYDATLPAMLCGSTIEFYVRAQDASLQYFYDPDPASPNWAMPATSVQVVFADDGEADLGWTVSGDVPDGQWDRGAPVGGGDRGDPPSDFDGSGQCYLTDNVDDNSDVDDGTTILTSPVIDLSTGDAIVHYARWYSNDAGADPNNDEMQVYISNDTGLSWVLVENIGPTDQAGGEWYENSFWASSYVTPTGEMQLRFDVSDLNDPSVVEAGLDDVTVTVYACEMTAPLITTESVPNWTVGAAYSQHLEASGGTGTLTWSDKNGNLTGTGLTLAASGLLSGVPAGSGTLSFMALVVDSLGESDEKQYTFQINPAVQITTASLPDWTVDVAYSQQLTATGGTGRLVFSDRDGDLAGTGLSLSPEGLLSGTPVSAGTINFTLRAADDIGAADEDPMDLLVNDTISITTDTLPDAIEGIAYSHQLEVIGGTAPLTWSDELGSLSGSGLTLSATGLLSGTPTAAGPLSFTAQAVDTVGASGSKALGLTVLEALQITTVSLPDWTVGVAYSQQLEASGGSGIYSWLDLNDDLLGSGLSLSATGLLSGIPVSGGLISFTARVIDEASGQDDAALDVVVSDSVQITTASLPDWTVGVAYSQQLTATGGTGTLAFSDRDGDLAGTGLSLSPEGLLSGTPVLAGTINFTLRVADEIGAADEDPLGFTVNMTPEITTTTIPDAMESMAYGQTLLSTGGTGNHIWSDKFDDLSGSGLALSTAGLLSGTPTVAGEIAFTAEVTDEVGATDDQALMLTVLDALQITTTTLPDWTSGGSYSQQLAAEGGLGSYTWSDRDADLVGTGLTLSVAGLVSGVIAVEGTISFTALVVDSVGGADEQLLSFVANPAPYLTTSTLPDWTVGWPYSEQLYASGGTGTVTFADEFGDLVGTGLVLSIDGLLAGSPLATGVISFSVVLTDEGDGSGSGALEFAVNDVVSITTDSLPDGKEGEAYSVQLTATGGTEPLLFSDRDGDLVGTGLTLAADGLLSGDPFEGTVSFTALVTDIVGSAAERLFTFEIAQGWACGDINNDGVGPDITDLTFLVFYMFQDGEVPPYLEACNVDGNSEGPDIGDLTHLVFYMFQDGEPLDCSGDLPATPEESVPRMIE